MRAALVELSIAVVFVCGIEGLAVVLQAPQLRQSRWAWLIVIPLCAVIAQAVLLAHYHLKVLKWQIHDKIEDVLNGWKELLYLAATSLSLFGLLLITRLLPQVIEGRCRKLVLICWAMIYGGYFCGDWLIRRYFRVELLCANDKDTQDIIQNAMQCCFRIDLELLLCGIGMCLIVMLVEGFQYYILILYSTLILASICEIYWFARAFLLAEPKKAPEMTCWERCAVGIAPLLNSVPPRSK